MADLFVVVPALLQLLGQLVLALGGGSGFPGVGGVVHHVLHPVDLGFVHTLHLVQVVHTQGADGIRGVAVEVDQCLKAVLLAAVEQPVDGPLAGAGDRVGLAVILEEIVQEIVADDLPAGGALVAQCFGNVIQVCFQRIRTVHHLQPVAQAGDNIIVQIFFIGDGDDIIFVREEHLVYHNTFIAVCTLQFLCRNRSGTVVQLVHKRLQRIRLSCKKQTILINRVAPKHTAHGIAEQALDVSLQICLAHGHIFLFHFRGQFILQAVNINKNAVQFFLISFQLFKALLAQPLPQQIANFQRAACFRQVAIKVVHSSSCTGSIP